MGKRLTFRPTSRRVDSTTSTKGIQRFADGTITLNRLASASAADVVNYLAAALNSLNASSTALCSFPDLDLAR